MSKKCCDIKWLFNFERWSLVLLVKEIYFLRTKFDNKTNIQPIFVIVLSVLGLKEEREGYKKKWQRRENIWLVIFRQKKNLYWCQWHHFLKRSLMVMIFSYKHARKVDWGLFILFKFGWFFFRVILRCFSIENWFINVFGVFLRYF
jgi:hypothetical protein